MKRLKNILYSVIVILFILLLIEGLFRVFGAGHPNRMLIKEKTSYGTYYKLNWRFAEKYFPRLNNRIPSPASHFFKADKPDSVYRIVVLGESTSLGFPYNKLEAFPHQIQQMLNNTGCYSSFEVINFSMTAINSHIGADMVKEIAKKCQPDLVLIYFGHNEFIGIGGAGTYHKFFFRVNYCLSHLRFYQALKSVISRKKFEAEESLFEIMTKNEGVAYQSDVYKKTMADFEENYTRMVSEFRSKNIPVMCLGVVKNLRDFPPGPAVETGMDYNKIISDSLHFAENFSRLSDTLTSPYAMFRFGRLLYQNGYLEEANLMLQKAVDYDPTRFRAPSDINRIIEEIAKNQNCDYIDCQEYFNKISPFMITGNDLILEHVHPTIGGHFKIAGKISQHIIDNILDCPDYTRDFYKIRYKNSLPDNFHSTNQMLSFYQSKYITEAGYFNPLGINQIYAFQKTPDGRTYEIADSSLMPYLNVLIDVRKRSASLPAWHINYGNWLLQNKLPRNAIVEYELAYLLNPVAPGGINNYAVLLYESGEKEKAVQLLTEGLEMGYKNSKLALNLAYIYMQMGRRADAEKTIRKYYRTDKDVALDALRPMMYNF